MASSARLDELKKKFEENPRRYFAPLANEYRKSGDVDQAISLCRTHLPLQPGHISGHIVLAQALFEAGSLDESRDIFHSALGLDPENLIALRYLGDIAKQMSDVSTARSWYERVLEVDPRNDEIVQLVRDLDAPPAPPAAVEEPEFDVGETLSAGHVAAAPTAPTAPAAPPTPAASNDARFAPLSLDEVDLSDLAMPSSASPNEALADDKDGGWSSAAANADATTLDDAGIDPFDLDPAGSIEALYDPNATSAHDDLFFAELSGEHATADEGDDTVSAGSDVWTSGEATESAAPAATPEFDEGSFYLEPPPPDPVQASTDEATEPDSAASAAEQIAMPGLAAFSAEYSFSDEPSSSAAPAGAEAGAAGAAEPNEVLASVADQPTAEWQPPSESVAPPAQASAPDDGLGLEVMEFVPPSEASLPAAAPPVTNADVVFGNTPEIKSSESNATPAAFVTETMAELYLQQGFRNEALAVYRELLARNPSDANLRDRIDQIESGSLSSIGMAAVSGDVVESAIRRQHARPERSVRSFFASLASRRAPAHRSAPEMEAGVEPPVEQAPAPADLQILAERPAEDRSDRITPLMSAAETLASFDPFAETPELPPGEEQSFESSFAPNLEAAAEALLPNVEPAAFATETAPSAPSEDPPARRTLEDLFPDTPIPARTEVAAQTFATAFGRAEPQGRPTRAASNELKLDHVFRGAPEGAPAGDGGFSFDQFFSDSRASGGDGAASATTAPDTGRGGSGDAHDIEQFTAWLEGLKKK